MNSAVKVGLFVLTVFLINHTDSAQCCRRDYCECSDDLTKVICTDIGRSIPTCIPEETVTELRIQDSPEFSAIGRNDLRKFKNLQKLSIVATGLKKLHKDAFKKLENFETIEIVSSSSFTSFSSGTFSGMTKLKNITVQCCNSFKTLQNKVFGSLNSLEVLNLKDNNITEIDEDILDETGNVTSIDLSGNAGLEYLPRNVFSHLEKLNALVLKLCGLRVLYPEHVKTPREKRSLTSFDGTGNDWQCNQMCEFIEWLETDSSFREMATMGLCSDSNGFYNKPVLFLHPEDVCPQSVSIVLQALLGVLFASILALTCCFLLVTCVPKHCKCFKRSSSNDTSIRTSRSSNSVVPVHDHRNQAYVETNETQTAQLSNEAILQADCDVGDWNINNVDPPLYDVVVGNSTDAGDKENYENFDSESDIDIAPPPYDETPSD